MGESTADVLWPAMDRWTRETNEADAYYGARPACSPLSDPITIWRRVWSFFERWTDGLPCRQSVPQLAGFYGVQPDVIVMIDWGQPLTDHFHPDDGSRHAITGELLRSDLQRVYEARIAEAAAAGARVILTTMPRVREPWRSLNPGFDDDARVESYNAVVRSLAAAHAHVQVSETGPALDAGAYARSDGLHIDAGVSGDRFVREVLAPLIAS